MRQRVVGHRGKGVKEKAIKIDDIIIKYFKVNKSTRLLINFGRYEKGRRIDTCTVYDAIFEKHKTYDDVWLDIQDKQAIGLQISLMKK